MEKYSFHKTILVISFVTAIMPFAGFPLMWESIFVALGGVVIFILTLIRIQREKEYKEKDNMSFSRSSFDDEDDPWRSSSL